MSGITINIEDGAVREMLNGLIGRAGNMSPVMAKVAQLMLEAVRKNFRAGGRPEKWPPLKHREGQPLRDTNRLMNSVTASHTETTASAGTNVIYAAMQNFGASKGQFGTVTADVKPHKRVITQAFGRPLKTPLEVMVRAHQRQQAAPWGNIPARPFMVIPDDDLAIIRQTIINWIARGE